MRVALAQINTTVGDFEGNGRRILDAYRRASEQAADLVLFPELATCGYPPLDLLQRASFVEDCESALRSIVPELTGPAAIIGTVRRNDRAGRPLHNSAALVSGAQVVGFHDKVLLPSYDVFDEDRYFEPGAEVGTFTVAGRSVGIAICEDAWTTDETLAPRYRRDPVSELVAAGAEIICCPSASPFHIRKPHHREGIFRQQAAQHGVPLVVTNLVGGNTELVFDGGSLVVVPGGVVCRLPEFEESIISAEPLAPRPSIVASAAPDETERVERMAAALVLGLRDYFRKCGFSRAVIGLSGGIDSAVTAALACDALGAKAVRGVAMPGPYSSEGSIVDARELAAVLGIELVEISIQSAFEAFRDSLTVAMGSPPVGVTEENLQARARGAILMALSNQSGDVVLTTGNKSELAVGYCTLYGDMCGGLCPIGDVPKMDVYRIAELDRYRELIPDSTRTKPPSAELRPNQADQDSLPAYEILDEILEAFVERQEDAEAIAAQGYDLELVRDVIAKVERNEYKRRQAAPTLRVTSKAFGMGRRIPIARRF